MTALVESGFSGKVAWVGSVGSRDETLRAEPADEIRLVFEGIAGDSHGGLTRPSCVRVEDIHPLGTPIRNTRQASVLSAEELGLIATDMGVDELSPALLGANILTSGIPNLTLVPPASRLQFSSGATLVVDLENHPCNLPAREIEKEMPGFGRAFKMAAMRRRGITAWVEREGVVRRNDRISLFVPAQPAWPH